MRPIPQEEAKRAGCKPITKPFTAFEKWRYERVQQEFETSGIPTVLVAIGDRIAVWRGRAGKAVTV